jgi:uncharacterized protein YneF (UPF0154 family)
VIGDPISALLVVVVFVIGVFVGAYLVASALRDERGDES